MRRLFLLRGSPSSFTASTTFCCCAMRRASSSSSSSSFGEAFRGLFGKGGDGGGSDQRQDGSQETPKTMPPAPTTKVDNKLTQLEARNYQPSIQRGGMREFYTMAHITAPKEESDANKKNTKSLDITAVMDASGSMSGQKLDMAKEALKFVVKELGPNDRFGLVEFNSSVRVVLPLTTVKTDAPRAIASVDSLYASGTTNLSGGLFTGIDTVVENGQNSAAQSSPTPRPRKNRAPVNQENKLCVTHTHLFANGSHHYTFPIIAPATCAKIELIGTDKKKMLATWNAGEASATFTSNTAIDACTLKIHGTFDVAPTTTTILEVEYDLVASSTTASTSIDIDDLLLKQKNSCTLTSESARVVLLFTDGQANVGITDPAELTSATRRKLDGLEKDATVFTFGFGADHNATLLKGLAEISQGTYYYVQNAAQMPEIFGDCLGGLQSIVAQKLNLRMKPAPGVKVKEVMTAYPSSVDHRTGTASVQMKDLYSEEQRDVVVRLEVDMAVVDPDATKDTACLCEWTLSCLNTLTDKAEVVSAALPVTLSNEPFTGNCDLKVDEQINRFKVTTEMEKARRLADAGNVAGARACLAAVRTECQTSQSHNSDFVRSLTNQLTEVEDGSASEAAWASEGQKRASQMEACHKQQRSNYSSMEEGECRWYSNTRKESLRSKAASK